MTRTRLEPLAVTAWALMANTVVTSGLGVIFWAIASRLYSPHQLGESAALVSAMILLSTISQLNLAAGIARLLPQVLTRRWRPVLGAYAATAVVGAALTGAFLLLVPRFSGFAFLAGNYALGAALLGSVVLWNLFALQDAVLTSARWAPAVPIENGLFGLLKIVLMVALAGGLLREGVFYAWLIGMAVLLLPVNFLVFSKVLPSGDSLGRGPLATAVPLEERGIVARYLAVDYAAALFSQGSTALLPLLVVGVLGRAQNAYFYVAFLIAGGVGALAQSLSISLVVEGAHNEANVVALARRSARRYVTFVLPGVALLILAAPLVLRPFGVAYVANGTTLLRLLLAGTTVHSITVLYMSVQRLRGRVSRILAAEAALLVLVAVGGVLGMRSFGLEGLGVAWLVGQAGVALAVAPKLWRLIGRTPSTDWRSVAEGLAQGLPIAQLAATSCIPAEVSRLTSPASGAWTDLLDGVEGRRVLLVDKSPGGAPARLIERGATVGIADPNPHRREVRLRILGSAPGSVVESLESLLSRRWDVICFDGVRPPASQLDQAAASLGPAGRLVVVAGNRWSPIRLADRLLGLTASGGTTRLHPLIRSLSVAGFGRSRVYGLLRSSTAPSSSFDVDSPSAAAEVLAAAAPHFGRFRMVLLRLLAHSIRGGWALAVVPAWAVVARSETPAVSSPAELPIVGRIGYEWTRGSRVLLGEPPQQLERHYEGPDEADAEAMALNELRRAGLEVAPRLVSRSSAASSRVTWCRGRPLGMKPLSSAQRRHWISAAATLLKQMQDATRRADGSVLVHGDYWLGNLLVDGTEISAVIDWGGARWGHPSVDADFLVDSMADYGRLRPAALHELRVARDLVLAGEPA